MAKLDRPQRDLIEIFGYAPDDLSRSARSLWNLSACPFSNRPCSKTNHDRSVTYGTCTVSDKGEPCIICPTRLYDDEYAVLRRIAGEGAGEFVLYADYVKRRAEDGPFVVLLGHHSGKEVALGAHFSMDWVLATVREGRLEEYVGVEVQSIDTTGNYRDTWYAYRELESRPNARIPASQHGLNWANVTKRLIPQLIRKGLVYSRSGLVKRGLYFVVPELVYRGFERVIGADIPSEVADGPDTLTVHTYGLSPAPPHGERRSLVPARSLKISLTEFARRFITGANLPPAEELDARVRSALGCR